MTTTTIEHDSARAARSETLLEDIELHLRGIMLVCAGLDPQGSPFHVSAIARAVAGLRHEVQG